jgi:hypothetical protein
MTREPTISERNHVWRSVSFIQFSIRLAAVTSLCPHSLINNALARQGRLETAPTSSDAGPSSATLPASVRQSTGLRQRTIPL